MEGSELFLALRKYHRTRRAELLEGLLNCTDIEKQRGRVRELDESYKKLEEIYKTTGDAHDDDSND